VEGAFWQRVRWSKSAWLGAGFVLTNLRWMVVLFYMFPLAFALMWPFVVSALITLMVRNGSLVLLQGVMFWVICAITQTAVYAVYRPGFTLRQRLGMWALSPIYPLFGLLILRPAAYWALTQLKSTSWHTREVPVLKPSATEPVPAPSASAASSAVWTVSSRSLSPSASPTAHGHVGGNGGEEHVDSSFAGP
jgi:hyaluronan synthase